MDLQRPRSAYNLVQMVQLASELGLPLARCLEGSGVDERRLSEAEAEFSGHAEIAVIANIVRHLDHVPALGLRMGQRFHMSAYGLMAFALCSCQTVGDATRLAMRYGALSFSLTATRLDIVGGDARIWLEDGHVPVPLRRFVIERDLVGLTNIGREMFSSTLPMRHIALAYPAPAYAADYARYLGLVPEFSAPQQQIVFDRAVMESPIPQADAVMLRRCEQQLQVLLERRKAGTGTAGRVRQFLRRQPGMAVADMAAASAELQIQPRSLRRSLQAEGVSFRALADELRQSLAEELLLVPQLSVEDVAHRLGYDEVASFTRAFKRWTGLPPGKWRSLRLRGLR
ncbi:AraC family transcriptional regulator [Solimonas sp. K1W22B-7]|uniref:AraC family transcriptional regulator n=1 Tax=Solimonas sp. K1W22B-7 TaxID=2303331 RepID=UPI000E32D6F4|nr:AraC family transcriptional regulator [Solimonas sp. K1W22B-7]AXQ31137.1 AraC family transcriptional regulator [Solimonas sp. K1W22B-7]